MPYRKLISACLALLLCFSCYPLSVAYASDEGFFDGRSYYSPVSDSGSGGNPDADGQAVEAEAEEAYSLNSPLPSSGGGFAFSGDILSSAGYDHSGAIQVDGMADVDGRFGEAANADAQEQHEADSGGGEAAAQDGAAAEAQEVEASPFSQEVATADYGISLAAVSDSQFNYALYGMLSEFSGGVSFSVGGHTLWYKVGSVVYVVAALYQMIHAYLPNISSEISSIQDLTSHIGVNTDLFKTHLSNISSRLYSTSADGYDITSWVAGVYNHVGYIESSVKTIYNLLSSSLVMKHDDAKNSNSIVAWIIYIYDDIKTIKGYLYSADENNYSVSGWVAGVFKYVKLMSSYLYATNADSSSITGWVAGIWTRVDTLRANSNSIVSLLSTYLPKLSAPVVSVSFDDNDLGAILASIDGVKDAIMLNAAVDFVDTVVGDFSGVVDALQASTLESTMQSAFPFCIPAIVKQLLGLLQAEPMPPSFDFEIGGEVMHVDASQMQGFADIVSWACRFIFVIGLLFASRRFIFWEVAK